MLLINILFLSSLIDNNNFKFNNLSFNNLEPTNFYLVSNDIETSKIGIVDFRKILRSSNSMKVLGNKFIIAEKKMNKILNFKQDLLKKKEKKILNQKDKIPIKNYKENIKLFKQEVLSIQSRSIQERSILNKSFQKNQKKLKNILASIIKDISIKKNINIVLLKENIFLLNDQSIDFTNEALNLFNNKTKNMKIEIVNSN